MLPERGVQSDVIEKNRGKCDNEDRRTKEGRGNWQHE